MEPTSLYYFFSTIAQVLAAISALLAIFTQFKISEITTFLVGDGEATYNRMMNKEEGYRLPGIFFDKKFADRLRDAIARKSILGILEAISALADEEKEEGKNETTNPRGTQFLKRRFEKKQTQISDLRTLTKNSISIAFIAIFISITSLLFVQYLSANCFITWILILLILTLTIISMYFTIRGVYKGLTDTDEA